MKHSKTLLHLNIIALILALALSGCAGQAPATGTSTPAPVSPRESSPIVSASGEVMPAQWTTLSFAQAGNLAENVPTGNVDRRFHVVVPAEFRVQATGDDMRRHRIAAKEERCDFRDAGGHAADGKPPQQTGDPATFGSRYIANCARSQGSARDIQKSGSQSHAIHLCLRSAKPSGHGIIHNPIVNIRGQRGDIDPLGDQSAQGAAEEEIGPAVLGTGTRCRGSPR